MFVAYWRGCFFKLGRTPTKCLVQFRFLPFPRPLGESIFDSNMNLCECAVSEVLTTPHMPGGEQDTAIPSDLHCLWKVRGHFFLCIFVGPPFLRKKKKGTQWGLEGGQQERSICLGEVVTCWQAYWSDGLRLVFESLSLTSHHDSLETGVCVSNGT